MSVVGHIASMLLGCKRDAIVESNLSLVRANAALRSRVVKLELENEALAVENEMIRIHGDIMPAGVSTEAFWTHQLR